MPFGLVMSQHVILEECPGTLGLIDDVIVYGKTKEHDRNLHNLMKIAQVEGLWFNSEKFTIDQKQIHFLGAIYHKNGVRPDPKQVEEIKMLPSPKSIADLQRVLRIITYMAPFIPHLSDLTSPMRDLLKTNQVN